jgi:hypothetical protein
MIVNEHVTQQPVWCSGPMGAKGSTGTINFLPPNTYLAGKLRIGRRLEDHARGHPVLKVENIFEATVEAIRPEMRSRGPVRF